MAATSVGTARGRGLAVLVVGAAMMQAAVVVGTTAATLMFASAFGDRWGSVPYTATVVGAAAGSVGLTRPARRTGMIAAYSVAAVGAGLALTGAPVLVVAGLFLVGCGSAGSQSARYAGADLYPVGRQGVALGAVVWAGTIGGVGGPVLMGPVADLSGRAGIAGLTGALLLASAATVIAATVTVALPRTPAPPPTPRPRSAQSGLTAPVRTAMVAMMAAQGAMVAIMVAAPLHLHRHGSDLGAVGTVIGVHVFGMFALAPLNGHLTDRYGARRMLLAGLAVVSASGLLILSPVRSGSVVALFLLGYGWSLAMVAGSALLVTRVPEGDRIRVQGGVDARVWCVTAVTTLSSGQLFALGGYATLAAGSVALVLVATAYVARGEGSDLRSG
jgi:MFS family permease